MTATPTPIQQLVRLGMGFAAARALYVAAKLGIADLLRDGPRSAHDLARQLGVHPQALGRVLRFLAGEGIFQEDAPNVFRQTELSDALRADAPGSPRDLIIMLHQESYDAWGCFLHSVETGETAFEHVFGAKRFEWLARNPEAATIFQRAMVSLSAGVNAAIAEAYEFSGLERIVDVGGGHGALLSIILRANPHLSGVLFDLEAGIAAARAEMGGALPRCQLIAGDFFASVPEAGDAYVLKSVIHDWDDERAVHILRNCRRAMKPEARILVVETILPSGNDPHPVKLLDLQMLAVTGGRERTQSEYEKLFALAGLRLTRVLTTRVAHSILEAVAA